MSAVSAVSTNARLAAPIPARTSAPKSTSGKALRSASATCLHSLIGSSRSSRETQAKGASASSVLSQWARSVVLP